MFCLMVKDQVLKLSILAHPACWAGRKTSRRFARRFAASGEGVVPPHRLVFLQGFLTPIYIALT